MVDEERTQEREPNSQELALSWLGHRGAAVEREIASTNNSLRFTENYKMPVPGPRPHAEDGGSDFSDWQNEELEYQQWPEEQEGELSRLNSKLEQLDYERFTINEHREEVESGDTNLIRTFSELEKGRREKIAEAKRKEDEAKRVREEQTRGKEMEGAQQVENQLKELTGMAKEKRLPQNKPGESGWTFTQHFKKDEWNPRDWLDFNKKGSGVGVRVYEDTENGLSVEINDFSNPKRPAKEEKYKVEIGDATKVTVKSGKIYDWGKGTITRSYQWGYGDYSRSVNNLTFEQEDMNNVKDLVSSLSSDMQVAAQ